MVDAHALGACGLGRAGSNPASPTNFGKLSRGSHYVVRTAKRTQTIGL